MRAVELALDAVEPLVMKLIADPAISAEHAMHVVVMERAGEAGDSARPFNEAIAVERSFGDPSRWQADYREYAIALIEAAFADARASDGR